MTATELIKKINSIRHDANLHFTELNEQQINYKPSASSWSIAQCLQHIIRTNESYYPAFDRLTSEKYSASFWERKSPFTKSIGKNMKAQLGPTIIKPFKAPRLFQPSLYSIPLTICSEFITHLDVMENRIQTLFTENNKQLVICSPVSNLITISLPDALEMIVGHTERHYAQAKRILTDGALQNK